MKKIQLFFCCLFVVVLSSCGNKISNENIVRDLDGYWEIEKAILPDGTEKDYSINSTIDFFQLEDKENLKGARYKVMPQLSGEYLTNEVSENFQISNEDDKVVIHYTTEFANWQEELLSLSTSKMVVKNEMDIIYHYKRAEPLLDLEKK